MAYRKNQARELVINVQDHGAKGDGTTLDETAINAAINAVSAAGGGTVRIPATAAGYAITRSSAGDQASGCIVAKPNVKIIGNNTKLILKGNTTFFKCSSTTGTAITVTADTDLDDTTLEIASSATLTVGMDVLVRLGQAAYDAAEPDWWLFAKVSAIPDATHVTLDRPVCKVMSVAATPTVGQRAVVPITLFMENVEIDGFNLVNDMTGGANAEEGIYAQVGRHFKFDNITGENTGAGIITLQYVDHVEVPSVTVRSCAKQGGQASKGRGIAAAESRNVRFGNVYLKDCEGSFVLFEGRSESVTVDNLRIENGYVGRNNAAVELITHLGNCRIEYGDIWASGAASYFYDTGGTTGNEIHVKSATFNMDGDPLIPSMAAFQRTRIRGNNYSEIRRYSKTFPLHKSMSAVNLDLPSGLVRHLRIYASSTTGITNLYLSNKTSNGASVSGNLVEGQLVEMPATSQGLGSGYVFNALEPKRLIVYTDGTLVAGTILTVDMDYFAPATDDGSFGRIDVPDIRALLGTIQTKSANYTALMTDSVVLGTGGSSGGITITLPTPVYNARLEVKKVDAGTGAVTVSAGSSTLDGAASFALAVQNASVTCLSDGTNWWIL